MFSYQQIARWLPVAADPIVIEDWLANREYLGEDGGATDLDRYLENAYLIEEVRAKKDYPFEKTKLPLVILLNAFDDGGTVVRDDVLVVAAEGLGGKKDSLLEVQIVVDGQTRKQRVGGGTVEFVDLARAHEVKVYVHCRGSFKISGQPTWHFSGRVRVICFDTRGRPLQVTSDLGQRQVMEKIYREAGDGN